MRGIAVIAIAAAHPQARAQSGSAAALHAEGYRLLDEGKLAEACEAFEASIRALPGAGTYYALGECRASNGQLASAWSAYQTALARAKDDEKRRWARKQIAKLEPRLSYLTISVSAANADGLTLTRNGISIDPMLWNRALPIDGGDYVIEGRLPGREAWRTTVHVPSERGAITAAIPDLENHTKLLPRPSPPGLRWDARRKVALGFAATTIVAAGLGIGFELAAHDRIDRARTLCPVALNATPGSAVPCARSEEANGLIDSGNRFANAGYVMVGVAAASAVTAGVLWFTGGRERRLIVVPSPTPDGIAVTATRRF